MTSNRRARSKRKERQLTINSVLSHSDLGLTLEYLNQVESANVVAGQTLSARFSPFAIPKDTPGWEAIAIRSANALEDWARSIREYANLPQPHNLSTHSQIIDSNTIPQPNGSMINHSGDAIDRTSDLKQRSSLVQPQEESLPQTVLKTNVSASESPNQTPVSRLESRLKKFSSH
ncbi:MAG: hypothetical protein QNJ38_04970 [Prochloraceae cyanobacterium]|nr:hypothetical protein [Prochloraceae cyanobacterium]